MRQKGRARAVVFALTATAAIIAACGGGDDSEESSNDAGETGPDAQASDATVSDATSRDSAIARDAATVHDSGLCADGAAICGNGCIDTVNDLANCGACDLPCFTGQTCAVSVCSGAEPALPRPMAPLSGMRMTTRRPTFKWELPISVDAGTGDDSGIDSGIDGGINETHVQICSDRACTHVVADLFSDGSSAQPTADLPPGGLFWRLFTRHDGRDTTASTATWVVFIPQASAPHESSPKLSTDVNGDGLGDIALMSEASSASVIDDAGVAEPVMSSDYVFLGRSPNPSSIASTILLPPKNGQQNRLGYTAAFAGDINGDGFADLTTDLYDQNADHQNQWGLFLGSVGGLPAAPSFAFGDPDPSSGPQILSSWGVGDLNGDGFDELGAFRDVNVGNETLTVLLGGMLGDRDAGSGSLSIASTAVGPIIGIGDINLDGYGDFVAGAYDIGKAYVFFGTAAGFNPATYTTLVGSNASNYFGGAIDSGDVDGDGYPDIIIGAPHEELGNIYIFRGSAGGISASPSWILHGENDAGVSRKNFGGSLAVGDFDGDGYDDVACGASTNPNNANEVAVYRGGASGPSNVPAVVIADADTSGTTGLGGSEFGGLLASPLDANGDGITDLVIGAYGATPGLAFFFAGSSPGGLSATPTSVLNGSATYFNQIAK